MQEDVFPVIRLRGKPLPDPGKNMFERGYQQWMEGSPIGGRIRPENRTFPMGSLKSHNCKKSLTVLSQTLKMQRESETVKKPYTFPPVGRMRSNRGAQEVDQS